MADFKTFEFIAASASNERLMTHEFTNLQIHERELKLMMIMVLKKKILQIVRSTRHFEHFLSSTI